MPKLQIVEVFKLSQLATLLYLFACFKRFKSLLIQKAKKKLAFSQLQKSSRIANSGPMRPTSLLGELSLEISSEPTPVQLGQIFHFLAKALESFHISVASCKGFDSNSKFKYVCFLVNQSIPLKKSWFVASSPWFLCQPSVLFWNKLVGAPINPQ